MFIAALFTTVKTWKQCPPTDEWIKKIGHMYAIEYYSTMQGNEIMPFAAT